MGEKKKKAAALLVAVAAVAGWIQVTYSLHGGGGLLLVEHGMIVHRSWRLPAENEVEPVPREGERVLLLSQVYRGFSLPPHPFFKGIMNHFGHNFTTFPPNAIAHLSAFIVMCECFIGCPPHWGLFKHIFSARSQTIKRLSQSDDKTHLLQLYGGLGFQKKSRSSYPALQLSESVRNWQSTWFYYEDVACPNASTGLPPFSLDCPAPPKQLALTKTEKIDIQPLVDALVDVVRRGVTGIDLLEIFLGRRIQPLQARDHAMWHYMGPEDSTRTNVLSVTEETVASWVLQITRACENPRGSRRVRAFSADNPPPNQEEEEGSQKGSVESGEYVSDSGETEEDSGEEEEEGEEQDSLPPLPEHRTKRRHEPAVPSAPPASSSAPPAAPVVPSARSTKRVRDVAVEPVGQPSKVAKPSGSKPQKPLPRIRVVVPVTSTVATSATSPARGEHDPMDADNVVSSQPGVL
ncbi:hypothetical protein ZWY2020_004333 [Hordeum vulgare]|nr:hypothetical protein ZWY2020_004333 [Hordeum vulgare]